MNVRGVRDLILIRHGESKRNISEAIGPFYKNNEAREAVGIFQDRLCPLTGKGHQQARSVGKNLKKEFGTPDLVIHSGFVRTIETTNGILKAYSEKESRKFRVLENHLIRERNSGYLMNYTEAEVREMFPWWQDYWYYADKFLVVPMGGESMISMAEGRLAMFFKSLEEISLENSTVNIGHKNSRIFVVSHGRAILGLRYLLEDWSYGRANYALSNENPPNCSVTYYRFSTYGHSQLKFANRILR